MFMPCNAIISFHYLFIHVFLFFYNILDYRREGPEMFPSHRCMKLAYGGACARLWKILFQSSLHTHNIQRPPPVLNCTVGKSNYHTTYCNWKHKSIKKRKSYSQTFLDRLVEFEGKDDFYMATAEWENLENDIKEEGSQFLHAFDYSMMKHLKTTRKPDLAQSFMDYIKKRNQPNTSTYLEYVDVSFEKCGNKGFVMFKKLIDGSDETVESVFSGRIISLCCRVLQTKYWKESITLTLDFFARNNVDINANEFVLTILKTALKKKDYQVFYDCMNDMDLTVMFSEMRDFLYQMLLDKRIPVDVFLELLKSGNCSLTIAQAQYLHDECYR